MKITHWIYLEEVDSTSTWLKENAKQYTHNATVIWSSRQTRGKGRYDRTWVSDPGGLYFSVLLLPNFDQVTPETLVRSFSEFLTSYALLSWNLELWVKPPNDVYYQSKKLAGILIENIFYGEQLEATILGVGINVNQVFPPDFDFGSANLGYQPVSLAQLLGREIDIEGLLKDLVSNWNPPL